MRIRRPISSNSLLIILVLFKRSNVAQDIDCSKYPINNNLYQLHNEKRRIHNSRDLLGNATLERSALPHATKLAQLRTLYHDPQGYGENLYSYAGSKLPEPFNVDPGAVKGWYGEVACYCGYETAYPPCVTGHFTQLIWNKTTDIGCATCVNMQKPYYIVVVCRYWPAGNICGAYKGNVGPPFGKPNNTLLDIVQAFFAEGHTFHYNAETKLLITSVTLFSLNFHFKLI